MTTFVDQAGLSYAQDAPITQVIDDGWSLDVDAALDGMRWFE